MTNLFSKPVQFEQLKRHWLLRLLVSFFSNRLTSAGRMLFLLWVISILMGTQIKRDSVYRTQAFTTVTLGIAWILSFFTMPKLRMVRRNLHHTSAGEELWFDVEIKNISRWAVHELTVMELNLPEFICPSDNWDSLVIPRLGPGEKVLLPIRLRCMKRGAYTLKGLYAASSFPLGLCRGLCRSHQESSFLVYPAFTTPESFSVPEGRQYQPGGILMSSNVGDSPEFMHTREYQTGDNPRHIHWTSWARLGKPIVKVYQEEYFVRLALIVDTEVPVGTSDAAFEASISAAAGIADYLSRLDYIIDIFAAGAKVYHFQAGRALAHFENILEILACLESTPQVNWEALSESILPEAPKLTAVIAIFTDWTPEREQFMDQLHALGVEGRILVIRDGVTSSPTPSLSPEEFLQLSPDEKLS